MTTKHLLITALCLLSLGLHAQTYQFNVSTDTYTDLTGSTSLNNGTTWDDPQFTIPIGFEFQYFDTLVTQIFIEDFGFGGLLAFNDSEDLAPSLMAYGADIVDRGYDFNTYEYDQTSQSNISYLLEGTAGSRILKIEWNNVGFYDEMDEDNVSTDYTNLQLWLYEGSNDVEVRVGPNSVTQPDLCYGGESGSFTALIEEFNYLNEFFNGEVIFLAGDPSAPTTTSIPYYYNVPHLNGTIPEGTVYKFAYETVSTSDAIKDDWQISLSPNPSNDYFKIIAGTANDELISSNILIINTFGQTVKEINFTADAIDISDLNAGTYFVQMNTATETTTRKLIKQ